LGTKCGRDECARIAQVLSAVPTGATAGGRAGDDVVDAEFKEVRDDK
jgi:hypothetical protein